MHADPIEAPSPKLATRSHRQSGSGDQCVDAKAPHVPASVLVQLRRRGKKAVVTYMACLRMSGGNLARIKEEELTESTSHPYQTPSADIVCKKGESRRHAK
jgi:hypothetical protein